MDHLLDTKKSRILRDSPLVGGHFSMSDFYFVIVIEFPIIYALNTFKNWVILQANTYSCMQTSISPNLFWFYVFFHFVFLFTYIFVYYFFQFVSYGFQ